MKAKEVLKILNLFIFWVFFLSAIIILADKLLPYKPSFPYFKELPKYGLPKYLSSLANFDGVHYLTIAKKGYVGTELIQAFFPLYPLMMRLPNLILDNYLLSGLVISHFFALLSFYSFYYLVKMDHGKKIAWLALIIFATFISSFYLRSLYSESLFLTLIFSSFIAERKKKYLLAGVLGGLASATRIVGIFIFPSLLLSIFLHDRKKWGAYFAVAIPSMMGLLIYMIYLKWQFGDYLYFFHVQEKFGANRQSQLIPYPQVIYRYFKIFMTVRPIDFKYYAYVQEFIASLFTLEVLVAASLQNFFKKNKNKIGWPYLLFAFLAYFLPPLTGNFSSMPRYVLACFPLFIYLAIFLEKRRQLKFIYLTISLIFLIINLILFTQGYWVA
ncbi:hypothetical protein KKI22_02520 [Patescibacteria group bacterium]|nr:hypothetical protein [Patescibacteria group bacterium]